MPEQAAAAASEPGVVEVVFTKADGRLHWHFGLRPLGEDGHGVWLACPPGTVLQRGAEPPKREVDGFVMLVPRTGWWTAVWNAEDDPEIYVDVTSPPRWSPGEVTMVDLDLDAVRRRDGTVALLDEDEFEEHRHLFGYADDVVASARASAQAALDGLARHDEPFAAAGLRWLAAMGVSPAG